MSVHIWPHFKMSPKCTKNFQMGTSSKTPIFVTATFSNKNLFWHIFLALHYIKCKPWMLSTKSTEIIFYLKIPQILPQYSTWSSLSYLLLFFYRHKYFIFVDGNSLFEEFSMAGKTKIKLNVLFQEKTEPKMLLHQIFLSDY